jgi:hypothetical protein
MKKRPTLKLAAMILAVALAISSCDLFNMFGGDALSPEQRVNSFISAVSGTQDIAEIKAQFHPSSNTYTLIDEAYWSTTEFDPVLQPFSFGDLTETDNGASVTVTTTFTSTVRTSATTIFVLTEDNVVADNWLISSVSVGSDTINSVR